MGISFWDLCYWTPDTWSPAGMVGIPNYWMAMGPCCLVTVPVFWLHAAVVYTAVAAFGCRTLPSSPRDPCGRHPHVDCMVTNPEGVNCRGNGVSQVPPLISSIPIILRMGPQALLYKIFTPCQLYLHWVYKGVRLPVMLHMACGMRGSPHPWLKACQAFPQLHGFSSIFLNPKWTCPTLKGCKTLKGHWKCSTGGWHGQICILDWSLCGKEEDGIIRQNLRQRKKSGNCCNRTTLRIKRRDAWKRFICEEWEEDSLLGFWCRSRLRSVSKW